MKEYWCTDKVVRIIKGARPCSWYWKWLFCCGVRVRQLIDGNKLILLWKIAHYVCHSRFAWYIENEEIALLSIFHVIILCINLPIGGPFFQKLYPETRKRNYGNPEICLRPVGNWRFFELFPKGGGGMMLHIVTKLFLDSIWTFTQSLFHLNFWKIPLCERFRYFFPEIYFRTPFQKFASATPSPWKSKRKPEMG